MSSLSLRTCREAIVIFTDLSARAVRPNHSGPGPHAPGPEGRYGRPTKGKPGEAPRAERNEKPPALTLARRTKRYAEPARPLARGGANGRMDRVMPHPAASPPPPSRAAMTRCSPRRAKSPVACTRGGPAPAPTRQWATGTVPEPRPGLPRRGTPAASPAGNQAVPAAGPGPPPVGRVAGVVLRPFLVGPRGDGGQQPSTPPPSPGNVPALQHAATRPPQTSDHATAPGSA